MNTNNITYRIRVIIPQGNDQDRLVSISQFPTPTEEIQKQWIQRITDYLWGPQSDNSHTSIRPWDLILNPDDGSVDSLPVPATAEGESTSTDMYPPHYRIPPASIASLDKKEQIHRQERFAFGSLLYEIACGNKPFEGLKDEEDVQRCYSIGEFPADVQTLPPPLLVAILSSWSDEFAKFLKSPGFILSQVATKAKSHIKRHPYLFAAQMTGFATLAVVAAAPAILGAIGFGALGPIAGTAATGWQASIGAVEAGSLFAWCQSAAMGGAAVNGIIAAGAAGGGVAALATTAASGGEGETVDVEGLVKKFKEVYKGGSVGELGGQSLR